MPRVLSLLLLYVSCLLFSLGVETYAYPNCSDPALKPAWYIDTPGSHGYDFYSCPMPRPQNPELRLTFSFKNEFGTVPPIPFGVNQVDLHLALEAGIQELRTKAQLTNDSFLLPQQPGMLSHYNITAGGAALHFLGYPCRNHTTIATSPKFTYTEIFEPIRYSDLVSIFEGVQGLLKIRDQWTKINAGIVRAETSEYGYDSSVIWYNSTKLGLLEMLDAGFEWHSLQGVAIDANFTCEGSVNATRPTAMLNGTYDSRREVLRRSGYEVFPQPVRL